MITSRETKQNKTKIIMKEFDLKVSLKCSPINVSLLKKKKSTMSNGQPQVGTHSYLLWELY